MFADLRNPALASQYEDTLGIVGTLDTNNKQMGVRLTLIPGDGKDNPNDYFNTVESKQGLTLKLVSELDRDVSMAKDISIASF